MLKKNSNKIFQEPHSSEKDIKAIESLLSLRKVDLNDEEMMKRFFPSQEKLLNSLNEREYSPKRIRRMCLSGQNIVEALLNYGLKFSSLKQAGVIPSSIIGMKYLSKHKGYLHSSEWESKITTSDLFEIGFSASELIEDGIEGKDISLEVLVADNYSLEQIKKMGQNLGKSFYTLKELFSMEEIIQSFSLKTLRSGGIPAKSLIDKYSYSELYAGGYSPKALQDVGADAKIMKELEIPAKKLRRGFRFYNVENDRTIRGAWFSIDELKGIYTPLELKEAGISAKKMKEHGYSKKDLEGVFVSRYLDKLYKN